MRSETNDYLLLPCKNTARALIARVICDFPVSFGNIQTEQSTFRKLIDNSRKCQAGKFDQLPWKSN